MIGLLLLMLLCSATVAGQSGERLMSKGKLVANIGMTVEEVRKSSSLELDKGYYAESGRRDTTLSASDIAFDFELAGSPQLQFSNCQYYQLRTGRNDDPKLVEINIGIAPRPLSWNELGDSMREAEQRLRTDGWQPARYKDGETAQAALNKTFSSAAPENFNVGFTFGKGDVALTISARRLNASSFISFIKLEPRAVWEKSANPFGHTLP